VATNQLQVERRTGKVRQSETDVLPLCYDTNWWSGIFSEIVKNKNQQQILQATVLLLCISRAGQIKRTITRQSWTADFAPS